jgi:transcriptional regulator with XRE-family HTH domain
MEAMSKIENDDVEQQLRQIIRDSGLSMYKIAKISNVSFSQISYFMNGHRTLTLPAVAAICRALEYELRPIDKRVKK